MTKIIGLTGGIGSGKTTVAKYFASKGIPVYIADEAAKDIMNDKEVVQEVQTIFSEHVIQENGLLDRNAIRKLVFKNKSKLDQLNKIIHPKVKNDFDNWLKKNKKAKFIIKEVAILFETNGQKYCDATILVTAPIETRIMRVLERDSTSRENILQIIKNQLPEEEKIELATYIIENVNLNITYKKVDNLIEILNNI
ncbi:dephospho-CoA kinase [Flavobacterium sp. F372]|uniref:Dephospho-CoA kinase n=1 Tax=Flavobacterium bernardetii TaxID=2813823 RepID=A0ABR7IWT0_9FLAO|nr:dephospho-CoA kinase [Flavobacterium bernardetii]MBC5834220.1 dephospho-CoA kinase [Flavobacterium bernardetii]NHF70141.1 dephospho-CoA kinase [Flavobacterium bernardetii]